MIKTIFRNTFLVGLFVLVLCAVLFFAVQYTQTIDDAYNDLSSEAEFLLAGLKNDTDGYLENLQTKTRVTWIDPQGEVLFDNKYGSSVSNQIDCQEVRDAMENGTGKLIRLSESGKEQAVYYAVKCDDGNVIRLSHPLSAIQNALNFISPAIWILVIVIVISGVLSYRAARQIVKPINEIDPDNPDVDEYPELAPLIGKLHEQKLTIQEESASREQMRREFSLNVSQELKNPITSISALAQQMTEDDVPEDKMKELAVSIDKESQRVTALMNDIVKLSQMDDEDFESRFEDVDLYEICSEVAARLKNAAEKRGISIILSGKSTHVMAVPQLLSEMIYNLCDNALKYNRPNGKVYIDVSSSDEGAVVAVKDTGIGIAQEHQDRIFERFYRVDKSHSREIGGTGLGLSIVKHGAAIHNAEVELDSVPDEGTKITLKFPVNR